MIQIILVLGLKISEMIGNVSKGLEYRLSNLTIMYEMRCLNESAENW